MFTLIKLLTLASFTLLFTIAFLTTPIQVQASDTIIDLGNLGGIPHSSANDINENGQIVGESNVNPLHRFTAHAFLYENGQMIDLGTFGGEQSGARGINESGQVVGWADLPTIDGKPYVHSFLYENGQKTDLGDFGFPNPGWNWAMDINDNGDIVGAYSPDQTTQHAYLYRNGQLTDLGALGIGDSSFAKGINNNGQIIGENRRNSNGETRAFFYENGQMIEIDLPQYGQSGVFDINNKGQVVGFFQDENIMNHGFLYENGQVTVLTNPGNPYVLPVSINDEGEIAWYYEDEQGRFAAVYENNQWIKLSKIGPENGSPTGPSKINNKNQIVGYSNERAVLWEYDSNNATSEISEIMAPNTPLVVNTTVNASATFSDANPDDTHTATWSWGDETPSETCPVNKTTCTLTESNGSGSVTGSHVYVTPGTYIITLTVKDQKQAQDIATYQYITVYDNHTDSVAGGSRFITPVGSVVADPDASGTTEFGFTAQYDANGNVIPDKNDWAQLSFMKGNTQVEFLATQYQSLSVNGSTAILKGTGNYNNQPGYSVLIAAKEGTQGSNGFIRYQIKDASGNVVYDTQPGAADTADPTTSLSKGKIKIN